MLMEDPLFGFKIFIGCLLYCYIYWRASRGDLWPWLTDKIIGKDKYYYARDDERQSELEIILVPECPKRSTNKRHRT